MSPRLSILLFILMLSTGLYFWLNIDWPKPLTLYRNYQRAQAFIEDNKQALDQVQQRMQAEFGNNTNLTYGVSINNDGVMTTKLQVRRTCGSLDAKRHLNIAIQRVHEAGLGWPDEVEFVYSCKLNKPSDEAANQ
ncbi:hypothetical protein AO067_18635 [Pseudomonas viridiflava ICMP 13104]|uniref:Uncharacterized protein n=2 Tax=Pseudomonas syringae group TaxID=136849 RepID=A0A0W0HSS5_PSEVI|nr:hypothetical protein AO067_18635 [Pseudomonas viridiflava ICMP 13104]